MIKKLIIIIAVVLILPLTGVFASDYIYSVADDNTVRKIDSSGNEVWTFDGHNDPVRDVAVDSDGYVYSASDDNTVRKIDSSGNEVWSFTGHNFTVWGLAVDSDGYVYSTSDDVVKKINPSGAEVWTFDNHTSRVYNVAVDSDGYVYSVSADETVRKIDSSGNEVWTFDGHTDNVQNVAVDSDGYVYSGSRDETVRKIDPSGNEVWTFDDHTHWIRGVAVDSDGYIYSSSNDETVKKIDSSGNKVWTFHDHTNTVTTVAVDSDGYVYSGSLDETVKKIDPFGAEVWSFTGHTGWVYGVAVDSEPASVATTLPAENIDYNSASLRGSYDLIDNPEDYEFWFSLYSDDSFLTKTDYYDLNDCNDVCGVSISGLNTNTTYDYRIKISEKGSADIHVGDFVEFTTLEHEPGDEPYSAELSQPDYEVLSYNSVSISVNWSYENPDPETAVLDVTLFEVEDGDLGNRVDSRTYEDVESEGSDTFTFSDLDPTKVYQAEATLIVSDTPIKNRLSPLIFLPDEDNVWIIDFYNSAENFVYSLFVPEDGEKLKENLYSDLRNSIFGPLFEVRDYFDYSEDIHEHEDINEPYDIHEVGIPLDPNNPADPENVALLFPEDFHEENPLFQRDVEPFGMPPIPLLKSVLSGILWLFTGIYIIKRFTLAF